MLLKGKYYFGQAKYYAFGQRVYKDEWYFHLFIVVHIIHVLVHLVLRIFSTFVGNKLYEDHVSPGLNYCEPFVLCFHEKV